MKNPLYIRHKTCFLKYCASIPIWRCDQVEDYVLSNNFHSTSHLFIKLPVKWPTALVASLIISDSYRILFRGRTAE